MGVLSSARDHLVPESLRPKVEAWGQAIFSPLWPKVGWTAQPTEPTARGMLRHTLLQFLTLSMHDPKLSAEAAKRGRAYAAVGEKGLNEEAVAPELAGTALGVAVRDGDGALFDALLAKLPSLADARLRSRILTALPFTRDPKRFEKALSLSVDPSLRANERPLPLFVGATVPETREATWRFFQEHYDLIIQGIPPPLAGVAPQLFGGFCDEDHAAQLEAFFRPKLGEQKEVALPLAHAVEQIRICAAVKAAQEKSAEALFQRPPPKG
jgi:alanyl aminopeptidase